MYSLFPGDCEPFATGLNVDEVPKPIVPCGAIANSLFNGRFNLDFLLNPTILLILYFLIPCLRLLESLYTGEPRTVR